LREINESHDACAASMTTYVGVLRRLAGDEQGNDPWRDDYVSKLDEAVEAAIEKYPESAALQSDFADRGFEIVGVTQYYNFQWDDEAKRASRAKEDVAPEEERQTLASFLEYHNLEPEMAAARVEGTSCQARTNKDPRPLPP